MATDLYANGLDVDLKFKRKSIELLSTPYMHRCLQNINNDNNKQQSNKENYLLSPFIDIEYKFNDYSINKSDESHTNDKSCTLDFYEIIIEKNFQKKDGDIRLKIPGTIYVDHKYTAFARMGLIDFLVNMGGLIGLWLGMSFIDMSEFIKLFIPMAKNILHLLRKMKIFRLTRDKIVKFINMLKKFIELIDWKRLFTILSIPLLLFQFYKSIEDYLKFSTDLSFEFIEYNRNETKYSLTDFPAITVCNEEIFEELFFDQQYMKVYNFSFELDSLRKDLYALNILDYFIFDNEENNFPMFRGIDWSYMFVN